MRYPLLASAGLVALCAVFTIPANAADCGCRDAVRAALAKTAPVQHARPVVKAPAHVARRAAPAADCHCRVARAVPAMGDAESAYDYASSGPVGGYAPARRWTVAPQGYVPPLAMAAPPVPAYDGPADLPPYAPMSYAPQTPPGAPPAYAEGYQDGYAYGAQNAITVEQQGWFGGVGYGREGGGGGGGGGGLTLTLAQPDSQNGPSYNSFGQSYGGDYQSANQVNAWRTQAFTPPANSGSGSK